MAELPTPHSIAIGTLISLYSDPNSPLMVFGDGDGGEARSDAEWSLRLMGLLQRLVLTEDEGAVVLPNADRLGMGGCNGRNPADEDGGGEAAGARDPLQETIDGILDNDEYFLRKHTLDGKDILDDVRGMFGGSSLPISAEAKVNESETRQNGRRYCHGDIGNGTLNFCTEPLSALLDRIDDAFAPSPPRPRRTRRTPPSLALLSRLQMASNSVDDLMNLLDEWHALLEGSHVGYPPSNHGASLGGNVAIAVDGESTFGIYLRKISLGMEEIPFEALARLWDALREFVREEASRRGVHEEKEDAEEHYLGHHDGNASSDLWLPSSPQIERIVRKTCLDNNLDMLLRPGDEDDSDSPQPSPSSTASQLSLAHPYMNLLETHPECPSLHFLIFLSSLANGKRSAALESLHRYFDYAMIHERKERAERTIMLQMLGDGEDGVGGHGNASSGLASTMASGMGGITGGMTGGIINGAAMGGAPQGPGQRGGAGAAGGGTQMGKIFKESNVMQFAAVLLAQTYNRFGYTRLSLQATEEAVRVAQQSGDEECVCFANGWLALISSSLGGGGATATQSVYASIGRLSPLCGGDSRPLAAAAAPAAIGHHALSPGEEEAMLRRCQGRALERGLTSLAAGASLELARRMASRRLRRDDDMNVNGSRSGASEENGEGSSLAWISIENAGRMPVAGSSSAHVGRGGMGVALSSSPGATAPTDIYNMNPVDAVSVHGRQSVATGGLWASTGHSSLASLSSCAALYSTGRSSSINEKTMPSMPMMNGPESDAWMMHRQDRKSPGEGYASILKNANSPSGGKYASGLLTSCASSILHEWAVRSCDLSLAQGLQTLLANRAAVPLGNGALASVEELLVLLSHSTHALLQRGEYDRAKLTARRACWLASRYDLYFHQGFNLLQIALVELEVSASAQSTMLPVESALPPLLECLHISEQHSMDPLHAMALTTLGKVLLCMDRPQKARAMLQAAMPLVMQHGHVWFQGEAYLTLAKCGLLEVDHLERGRGKQDIDVDVGSSSLKRSSGQQQHPERQDRDSMVSEMKDCALSNLELAAKHFEQIEDVCRLRQVYYIIARVCHSLARTKKRDEAAKMFAELSVERRLRTVDPVMAPPKAKHPNKQWNALRSVMIATPDEMRTCVLLKQQRGK